MFCLLVVLVALSLLAKWLARKTPLRKPWPADHLHKVQAEEYLWLSWFIAFFHCLIAWYACFIPRPYVIYFILLWHDIAYFWVPLNTKQTNKHLSLPFCRVKAVQSVTVLAALQSLDRQRGTRYQHHSVMTNFSVISFRHQLKTELYVRAYYSYWHACDCFQL